jgi:hypothetical protein
MGISGRTGHRDGVTRSGSLHAPAAATVFVFDIASWEVACSWSACHDEQ